MNTAIANGNFKTLVKILQAADRENAVQNSGPFTGSASPKDLKNMFTTIASNGNFRFLAECVLVANLEQTLETGGPFTLFAPNDVAFAKLTVEVFEFLLEPQNRDFLARILLYHLVPGNLTAADIKALNPPVDIKTLNGQSVTVTKNGNELQVNGARVIITDVFATNGIVHGIDTLLIPPAEHASLIRKLKLAQQNRLKSRVASSRISQ